LRVAILGSGSVGNAVFLEATGTRVMIDAGFSCRDLEARLTGLGVDPSRVDALLLSHEHGDHARGAERFASRFGCAVAATTSTLRCLGLRSPAFRLLPFEAGRKLRLGSWRVMAAPVPHDAADPVAFRIETPEGSIGYALDLGHAPEAVGSLLGGCGTLVVESNHDPDLLEQGPYPEDLKRRLKGPRGHLSNGEAAELIARTATPGTRTLVLAHLSQTNNRRDLALLSAHRALGALAGGIRLSVAEQGPEGGWIEC